MKTAVTVADVAIRSGHVIVQSTEPKHYQCEPTVATTIRALSAGQLGELIGAIANLNGAARVLRFDRRRRLSLLVWIVRAENAPHARLIAFKRYGVRDDLFTRSMSGKAGYKTAPGYAGHDRQPWPRIDR
jgi:hypothetical protein